MLFGIAVPVGFHYVRGCHCVCSVYLHSQLCTGHKTKTKTMMSEGRSSRALGEVAGSDWGVDLIETVCIPQ